MVRQHPSRQFLIRWFALLPLAAPLWAQTLTLDPQTLIPLDRVVATVNDAVILQSEIVTLAAGEISARESYLHRPLTPAERQFLMRLHLGRKIDQHALAQAAKTLGVIPPERVEMVLQDQLREEEKEQIRELGTLQKLAEERARQGRNATWQALEREQRVTKLADLTRQMAVGIRLQNQKNLFITPRMMRDFYRRHRELFVHGNRAQLGCIAIVGSDAAAVAAAAAAIWRTEDLAPEELVVRFADRGACNPETLLLDDSSRKTRRLDQVEFALAGPKGQVSDPIAGSGDFRLWKVLDHATSRDEPFDDPDVQRVIRDQMERDVLDRLLQQTIDRARQRTEVWQLGELR